MKRWKLTTCFTILMTAAMSTTASAKLPYSRSNPVVVIGNCAYSSDYVKNHKEEINGIIDKNTKEVYYCYTENNVDNIVYMFGGSQVSGEAAIRNTNGTQLVYKDKNGKETVYTYSRGEYVASTGIAKVDVTRSQPSNSSLDRVTIRVRSSSTSGIRGAAYFKVSGNDTYTRIGSSVTINTNDDYVTVYVVDSNHDVLMTGELDIGSSTSSSDPRELIPIDSTYDNSSQYTSTNSPGNINNNGLIAKDNEYIYYSNTSDGGKLYKKSINGIEDIKISEDNAKYINVVGDWVYYCNYSDKSSIYKVKTDGTKRQKISNNMAAYLTVVKDTIYYSNQLDRGKIYVMGLDGKPLSWNKNSYGAAVPLNRDEASYINVSGGWIYYCNNSDKGKPYKITINGTGRTKLCDDSASYLNIAGVHLFYVTKDGEVKTVNAVDKSAPNIVTAISNGKVRVSAINVSDSYIYYTNYNEGNKLYRVRAFYGNTAPEKMNNSSGVNAINLVDDDNVYFSVNGKMARVLPPIYNNKGKLMYGSEPVKKPKLTDSISKVDSLKVYVGTDDLNMDILDIQHKYLPDKVPAIMNDDSQKQLVVNWDLSKSGNITSNNGTITYNGNILGYGNGVTLTLLIPSPTPELSDISCTRPVNGKCSVTVRKLRAGDTVKIYDSENSATPIYQATDNHQQGNGNTANSSSNYTVRIDRVDYSLLQSGVYITVTTNGKAESQPVYYSK